VSLTAFVSLGHRTKNFGYSRGPQTFFGRIEVDQTIYREINATEETFLSSKLRWSFFSVIKYFDGNATVFGHITIHV